MNDSEKEEQIFEKFDLDDKKDEPFQEIMKINKKKDKHYFYIFININSNRICHFFSFIFYEKLKWNSK